MSYVHRCMIVPAALAPRCRELCAALAGPSGANMFNVGLSATGDVPYSHYISTGMVEAPMAAVLSDPAIMFAACTQAGIVITLAECTSILSSCDISEDQPFDVLARMTLDVMTYEQAQALAQQRAAQQAAAQ